MIPLRRLTLFSLAPLALAAACSGRVAVDEPTGGAPSTSSTYAAGGGPITVTSSSSGVGAGPVTTSSSSSTSASSSGASGGCTGGADQQFFATKDIWPVLYSCGMMFVGAEPQQLQCIEQETGLSSVCSDCFDIYLTCTIQNCLSQCISDAKSQPCVECRAQSCDAALLQCSGLSKVP